MNKESIMPYIEDIAHRLSDPYKYGAVSLMVGAGFSKNADCIDDTKTTPPNWRELAEDMFKSVDPINSLDKMKVAATCSGRNILSLAEKYEVMFDRSSLNSLIEHSISDESFVPGKLHKDLMSFNWNDVFTTNYDTLLERTTSLVYSKNNYKVVYSVKDLPGSVRPRIIKLHGSIGQSSNYIITEEDYRTYPIQFAPFVNTVQQAMIETRLCLLGFSGDDPNFLSWVGWLRDNLENDCLSIYLCGVFNTLSEADKKLIQRRGITIVDLSKLVRSDSQDPYFDSFNSFFDQIKSIIKQERCSAIDEISKLKNEMRSGFNGREPQDYNKRVLDLAEKSTRHISKYVCLPNDESVKISEFFYDELKRLTKCKDSIIHKDIIEKICYILYHCHKTLYDSEAEIIDKILISSNILYNYMAIYLLQMYRVDGKYEEYSRIKKIIEEKLDGIEDVIKNEYYLDFAKYYLSLFEVNQAVRFIKKISETSNEVQQIKKASLLIEVNKATEAVEILKRIKSTIMQKKYSETKISSLLGYINLVYRAAAIVMPDSEFSDDEYNASRYNCRIILIKMQEELIKTAFEEEIKESKKSITFRPNTKRTTITYGKQIGDDTRDISFNYVLLNDLLCLCQYSDHKDAYTTAVNQIVPTSPCPLWKWYRVFMMADLKSYEYYFNRVLIYKTESKWTIQFYDRIIALIEEQLQNNYYILRNIDFRLLFDIASRLSVVVDSDRIIRLLESLFLFLEKHSEFPESSNILSNTMQDLRASVDDKVLKYIISYDDEIIKKYKILTHLYSSRNSLNNYRIGTDKICRYLDSENEDNRNYGVELYQLFKDNISPTDSKKIKHSLWAQVDNYGFPLNNNYIPTAWLDEKKKGLKGSYKQYILNPQITHEVQGKGHFVFLGDPCREIVSYYYVLSELTKSASAIKITTEEVLALINYFKDYIDKEKDILLSPNFFSKESIKTKFSYLLAVVYILLWYAIKHKKINYIIEKSINEIIKICDSVKLDSYELKSLIENDEYKKVLDHYELHFYQQDIKDVFLPYMNICMRLTDMKQVSLEVSERTIDFFNRISYIDVTHSCKCFLNAGSIFNCLPKDIKVLQQIAEILERCYDRYSAIIINEIDYRRMKSCLDGMYNVSTCTYNVFQSVKGHNNLEKLFYTIIAKFKNNKLNEIRLLWQE